MKEEPSMAHVLDPEHPPHFKEACRSSTTMQAYVLHTLRLLGHTRFVFYASVLHFREVRALKGQDGRLAFPTPERPTTPVIVTRSLLEIPDLDEEPQQLTSYFGLLTPLHDVRSRKAGHVSWEILLAWRGEHYLYDSWSRLVRPAHTPTHTSKVHCSVRTVTQAHQRINSILLCDLASSAYLDAPSNPVVNFQAKFQISPERPSHFYT